MTRQELRTMKERARTVSPQSINATPAATLARLRGSTRDDIPKSSSLEIHDNALDRPWKSFGDQLQAIAQADAIVNGSSTKQIDPRLLEMLEIQHRAVAAGASEADPGDGGFLVSPEFRQALVERMYLVGEVYSRCWEVPITTYSFKFPVIDESARGDASRLGGVQVYFQSEADTLKATKPKFGNSELVTHPITGLLYLTNELNLDSNGFDTWATYAFSHALMFKLENAIINGTGAGQPQGVLGSPAVAIVNKETGQAAATIVSQNIVKMRTALWAASRKNAVFLYNGDLLQQLAQLTILVGTAGSYAELWEWASGDDEFDRLAGIPAIPSEYCQAPGTLGDLILCDFSRYVLAMREKLRAEVSIHVRFLTDESAFRFIMRVNGQPIDRSPITPLNGSIATSPFVALTAR